MQLSKLNEAYDLVLSLGVACQVAHQTKRLGLRAFSGPLDWIQTDYLSDLCHILRGRFTDFFTLEDLKVEGAHGDHFRVVDTRLHLTSVHDFAVAENTPDHLATYPQVKAKLARRAWRVLAACARPDLSLLFIRQYGRVGDINTHNWIVDGFRELERTLAELVRSEFHILAVTDEQSADFHLAPWGGERIIQAQVPETPDHWEGCDAAWDRILSGVRLRPTLLAD